MRRSSVTGMGERSAMARSAGPSPPEDRIRGWMPRASLRIFSMPSSAFSSASVTNSAAGPPTHDDGLSDRVGSKEAIAPLSESCRPPAAVWATRH
jgi:hypothetical protein